MTHPHASYIICATPRCGSHLLAEALQSTGLAGKPDEYFQANKHGQLQNEMGLISEIYGKKSLEDFRSLVLELGSGPNGVFGIILHWDYLHHVINNYQSLPQYQNLDVPELFAAIFHNPKYIWIQRRDKVRQAISWIKATKTGVWIQPKTDKSQPVPKKELRYDYYTIDFHYRRFVTAENAWAEFFKTQGIDPFVVVYEDLVDNYEQTAFQLLDYLEIPCPQDLAFKERKLQKQADTLNAQWSQKYRQQRSSFFHRILRFLRFWRFKLLPF